MVIVCTDSAVWVRHPSGLTLSVHGPRAWLDWWGWSVPVLVGLA